MGTGKNGEVEAVAETSNFNRPLKDYSDCIGKKYGHLTVLALEPREHTDTGHIKPQLCKARCDCGAILYTRISSVIHEVVQSCGCSRRKSREYRPRKAKRAQPESVERERSYIAEALKAEYRCPYSQEACLRSKLAHICCCECDKRDGCGWACKNTPQRCGARRVKKEGKL